MGWLQVRVLGMRGPWTGLVDVFIDEQFAATADSSLREDRRVGPYYTSPVLPEDDHSIRVVNRAEAGGQSSGDLHCLTVHGFDVLPVFDSECQWDPSAGPRA